MGDQEQEGLLSSSDESDPEASIETSSNDERVIPPETVPDIGRKKKTLNKGEVRKIDKTTVQNDGLSDSAPKLLEQNQKYSFLKTLYTNMCYIVTVIVAAFLLRVFLSGDSNSSSTDTDWRSKIDPDNSLSNYQRSMIRASLKPILDKSYEKDQDVGVSTLLILSADEKSAAKLARCLLGQINKKADVNQISTEINLGSHSGGKLQLDTNLRTLLNTTDDVRAVLLRDIGDIPSKDTLEQLRLLFAYCDGENPVIPHRLIIMTATSIDETEDELRRFYKDRLPAEHDFIDALMSRISGHTLYVDANQQSIC